MNVLLIPLYGLASYVLGCAVGYWICYAFLYRPLRVLTTPTKRASVSDIRPR